jgi:Glycosyltransferase 61
LTFCIGFAVAFEHDIVARGTAKYSGDFITARIVQKNVDDDDDIVEIWQQMWTFLLAQYAPAHANATEKAPMLNVLQKQRKGMILMALPPRLTFDLHDKRWLPSQARQRCTDKGTVHMTVFLSLDSLCIVHRTDLYSVQRTLELLSQNDRNVDVARLLSPQVYIVRDIEPEQRWEGTRAHVTVNNAVIPYVAMVREATLSSTGTPFTSSHVFSSKATCVANLGLNKWLGGKPVRLRAPVINGVDLNEMLTFHRIIGHEPRLNSLPELLSSDRVRFQLAETHRPPNAVERAGAKGLCTLFDLDAVNDRRIVRGSVRSDLVLVPTLPVCFVDNVHLLMTHRKRIYKRVPGLERVQMQRNRVLVATRRDAKRQLRDADTVLDALRSRFPFADVVEFRSSAEFGEDYRLARSAAVFVCVHGATALNTLFMHQQAQFIELHARTSHLTAVLGNAFMPGNMLFAHSLGIDYGAVRADADPSPPRHFNTDDRHLVLSDAKIEELFDVVEHAFNNIGKVKKMI